MEYRNHHGESFTPRVMMQDGLRCRFCGRVIRVRETYAEFAEQKNPAHTIECRDCLYDAPLNDFNREWRERERKSAGPRNQRPLIGRYDLND
jgi:hypothetical protein